MELVEEFERAGLTQRDFAALHGVNVGTFRSWLYKLRREGRPAAGLTEVSVVSAEVESEAACRLELPGGMVVSFSSAPSPYWLADLSSALVEVQ